MEARSTPLRRSAQTLEAVDWGAVWVWLLGFVPVLYLGLEGGGYDPLVSDQAGIAIWWILLVAVAVGALPRGRTGTLAWIALALFAAFVAWTALSLIWTESAERTVAEVARVATYLGVLCLAVFSRGPRSGRILIGGIGSAIVAVVAVALLSRLHPAWFPEAGETARFLSSGRERLSYPLNYWNALAALAAIGMPLLLQLASDSRQVAIRGLAAAAVPALMLASFLTFSRAGIAAAGIAVAVFLVFAPDRLAKLLVLAVTAACGAVPILATLQRDDLRHGLDGATARAEGNEMLVILLVACVAAGLLAALLYRVLRPETRPDWTVVPRRHSLAAMAVAAVAVVVVFFAVDGPGRLANAWDDFRQPTGGPGKGVERLGSVSGESRYQFWSAAVDEAGSALLTGTGAGTYELWWNRHADVPGTIHDAHSLYLQTLGETGIVGILLLGSFLAVLLVVGGRAALLLAADRRGPPAAALAACVAFCFTAIFDWMWQVPVLPVCVMLLGSILVTTGRRPADPQGGGLAPLARFGFAALAVAAIAALAIPLGSGSLVRQSQEDARAGDLTAALAAARSAQNVQPYAATPRLQQALVYEEMGQLDLASRAALAATEREENNWRNWLVLSRIEAQRGEATAAVAAYRRARELNPLATVFEDE